VEDADGPVQAPRQEEEACMHTNCANPSAIKDSGICAAAQTLQGWQPASSKARSAAAAVLLPYSSV
jgi:hypothetical protein